MTRACVVFTKDWMMNDCSCHGSLCLRVLDKVARLKTKTKVTLTVLIQTEKAYGNKTNIEERRTAASEGCA